MPFGPFRPGGYGDTMGPALRVGNDLVLQHPPRPIKDPDSVSGIDGPFRLRVTFDGLRRHDGRLYALYVA